MKYFLLLLAVSSFLFAAIDINHANLKDLQHVKGIGAKKAQAIIDYREQHGCFLQIEAIVRVKGVGQKVFDKNKGSLEVKPCN